MKKLSSALAALFVLAGCSSNETTETIETTETQPAETEQQSAASEVTETKEAPENVYVPNPQIPDDQNVVTIGETVIDQKGELTLQAYKSVNETIQVGPVQLIIQEVKVAHLIPDYGMIDFFHGYTHDEEFDFVKVAVEVKNTGSEPVKFTPVAFLQTSSGEQKSWEDDIYLEELAGELAAGESKQGAMGFVVEDGKSIQSVDLLTSDAVDENGDVMEKGKKVTVEF